MDSTQSAILRRVLAENKLAAEPVLVALVQTLTSRHVDCQIERTPGKLPSRGGQPRVNSLVAAQDALHEAMHRNAKKDPDLAAVQKMLFNVLTECQFAAEEAAGMGGDDDDDRPPMRLVRD